jgi:hypothetical protein
MSEQRWIHVSVNLRPARASNCAVTVCNRVADCNGRGVDSGGDRFLESHGLAMIGARYQGAFMKLSSLLLVVSLLSAAAVQAQTPPAPSPEEQASRDAVRKSCAADIQSLCADKKGHEAMMCLRSNPDKGSAGCKDALSKLHRPNPSPQ